MTDNSTSSAKRPAKRKDITQRMVLEAYAARDPERGLFADDILMRRVKAPAKVIRSAKNREYAHDYIEFGVSLATGWLTDAGKDRLAELRGAADV